MPSKGVSCVLIIITMSYKCSICKIVRNFPNLGKSLKIPSHFLFWLATSLSDILILWSIGFLPLVFKRVTPFYFRSFTLRWDLVLNLNEVWWLDDLICECIWSMGSVELYSHQYHVGGGNNVIFHLQALKDSDWELVF